MPKPRFQETLAVYVWFRKELTWRRSAALRTPTTHLCTADGLPVTSSERVMLKLENRKPPITVPTQKSEHGAQSEPGNAVVGMRLGGDIKLA